MTPFLHAIGASSDVVGPWSITREAAQQFRVTVSSSDHYSSEERALGVAGLLATRLVPASYSMVGSPGLAAIRGTADQWRAHVTLQVAR